MSDAGRLVATDKETTEVLSNFFALVFSDNCSSHSPQMFGLVGEDQGSNIPPTVSEDQVRDHLRNLNIYKPMGPDEIHLRVLRGFADVVTKPLSRILENL